MMSLQTLGRIRKPTAGFWVLVPHCSKNVKLSAIALSCEPNWPQEGAAVDAHTSAWVGLRRARALQVQPGLISLEPLLLTKPTPGHFTSPSSRGWGVGGEYQIHPLDAWASVAPRRGRKELKTMKSV